MRYIFKSIEKCVMCASDTSTHKVLGKRLNRSQGMNPARKTGVTTTVCQCSNCGLIYANPLPVPVDIQDHYGVPPEDYWEESYFELTDNYFCAEIARLKQLMDVRPGMTSLDIGAGLGKQMIALGKAGFEAYGLEPSRPFYERAISKMGIPGARLMLAGIEEADYAAGSFDFVSFGAVLEHLYDPASSIEKALRWVRPGGLIHIEVPSSEWLTNKIINLYYRLRLSDYVGNISPMHKPYHLYEFGLKSFTEYAARHDCEIAHYEYYVCQTFLPRMFDGLLRAYMKRTNQGMQLCVWLRKKQPAAV